MVGVIGDIHGCFSTLRKLVELVKEKYPAVQLYSVGDLVDRGNYSCEVIDYVISQNILFTPGNHDYMFLYYLKNPFSQMGNAWIYNDYESTLASYNNAKDKMTEHLRVVRRAPLFFDLEDCFISHAGISGYYKTSLPKNYRENLSCLKYFVNKDIEEEWGILWTRDELLDLGKLQIVGHTQKREVFFNKKNNALYIDTSVFSGNKLSAVIIEKNNILDTLSVHTHNEDIY